MSEGLRYDVKNAGEQKRWNGRGDQWDEFFRRMRNSKIGAARRVRIRIRAGGGWR